MFLELIELREMIEDVRPFLAKVGKAKASMMVRYLLDLYLKIDDQDGDIKVSEYYDSLDRNHSS